MKRLLMVGCVLGVMLLSGCSTMSNLEIDRCASVLARENRSAHLVTDVSYEQAFQAVVTVFHDLAISMPLKDFEGRRILGFNYAAQTFTQSGGSERYLVEFTPTSKGTEISIKLTHMINYNYDEKFISNRIQYEIGLQRLLKGA